MARGEELRPIADVAAEAGLHPEEVEPYGRFRAKVGLSVLDRLADRPDAPVVVVTAVTPTPPGEGKTTTSIGLTQGLAAAGKRPVLCLREPSMGPTFGQKGCGTGGGRAQVVPMVDINLHFTGDLHAVAAAHNLLAAAIDASLFHRNPLDIDPATIGWPRCVDVNDRTLRQIVTGLGGYGVPREAGFLITAASEVMAVLALASDLSDLRARLGRIVIAESRDGRPVTADDLRAAGAMAVLLMDALLPNLVQTTEGQPALVHTGPFGNIAHGNSSAIAARIARKLGDVVITEAGFGADLGLEKYCHIVAPHGLEPAVAVLVASVRALKWHGGIPDDALHIEDTDAVKRGAENLAAHIDIVKTFGLRCVVAVNRFSADTDRELKLATALAMELGADAAAIHEGFGRGGQGAEDLARAVAEAVTPPGGFRPLNPSGTSVPEQIDTIATRLYGAGGIEISPRARRSLDRLGARGADRLPVCMAKSHLSLSPDPGLRGRPQGFRLPVRDLIPAAGAGFVVALTGDILRMPGLGSEPAFTRIDLDDQGRPVGLV